jgi:hypothetical protein
MQMQRISDAKVVALQLPAYSIKHFQKSMQVCIKRES